MFSGSMVDWGQFVSTLWPGLLLIGSWFTTPRKGRR